MRVLRFAEIALLEGDYAEARRLGEASVVERQNSPQRLGEALLIVAGAAMYQHDLPLAYSQCRESLVQFHKIGSKPFIAKALRRFAYLAVMQGRWERAARLLGANQSLCQTLGMPLPPCERDESEQNIASVRQALAEDAFAAAWAEGNAMTWDQAADLARQSG